MDKNIDLNETNLTPSNNGMAKSQSLTGTLTETAKSVADRLHLNEISSTVRDQFDRSVDFAGETITDARGNVERTIRRYPLVSMAGAFLAGAALVGIFRLSSKRSAT